MKTIPAVKIALLLAFGLMLGKELSSLSPGVTLGGSLGLLLINLMIKRAPWSDVALAALLIFSGLSLFSLISTPPWPPESGMKKAFFHGKIISETYHTGNRQVYILRPDWWTEDGKNKIPFRGKLRLINESGPKLLPGTELAFFGALESYPQQRNPGGRNWYEDFSQQGIIGWIKPQHLTVLKEGKLSLVERLRWKFAETLHSDLPPRQAQLLTGMLLGDKSVIPEEMSDAFRRSGLYHLLVVSGANIGYLLAILIVMVNVFAPPLRTRRGLQLLGVWSYVALTGFSPPTVRAGIMISLVLVSFEVKRVPRSWNLWGAAALLILLFSPQQLFQPGFQLSFAAMAGVLFASDLRLRRAVTLPPLPLKTLRIKRIFEPYLFWPLIVSLCAVIFTAPILIVHFGGYAPSAIVTNLLAVPLAGALFCLTWVVLLLKLLLGLSLSPLFGALEAGTKALESLAKIGAELPGNAASNYGGFLVALTLLAMLVAFFWLHSKRQRWMVVLSGAAIILFLSLPHPTPYLQLEFLDVDQGDATLFRCPDGKTLLVDCGDANAVKFELLPSLKRRGIIHLEALLLTHFDRDHAGGAEDIMKSMRVNRLYVNTLEPEDDLGRSILKTAQRLNIPVQRLSLGDKLQDTPGVNGLVLWPPRSFAGTDNRASLVLKVTYGDIDVLLTGDITSTEERFLTQTGDYLHTEVLKVSHHGSDKSSSQAFLKCVHPEVALIGCGVKNRYGHPYPRVIHDLEALSCRIHRTDLEQAGVWRTNGREVWEVDWR